MLPLPHRHCKLLHAAAAAQHSMLSVLGVHCQQRQSLRVPPATLLLTPRRRLRAASTVVSMQQLLHRHWWQQLALVVLHLRCTLRLKQLELPCWQQLHGVERVVAVLGGWVRVAVVVVQVLLGAMQVGQQQP
jgi:hypothetical protein